ncbi:MAG: heavy-metal-associated domain-containing protein [Sphingobacteriaceae bacterium]|jgi:mercuric ion binding protein
MKIALNKLLCMLTCIFSFFGCQQYKPDNRMVKPGKSDSVFVAQVADAKCENCQKVIEDGMNSTDGIKQTLLNLNTKYVTVVYDPLKVKPECIQERIKLLATQIPCK